MEWSFKGAQGRLYGFSIKWRKGFLGLNFTLVGVNVRWKGLNIFLVNVYYSCLIQNKRKFWKDLCDFKSRFPLGEWGIAEDFNAIKKEGRGEVFVEIEIYEIFFCLVSSLKPSRL